MTKSEAIERLRKWGEKHSCGVVHRDPQGVDRPAYYTTELGWAAQEYNRMLQSNVAALLTTEVPDFFYTAEGAASKAILVTHATIATLEVDP